MYIFGNYTLMYVLLKIHVVHGETCLEAVLVGTGQLSDLNFMSIFSSYPKIFEQVPVLFNFNSCPAPYLQPSAHRLLNNLVVLS